MSEKMLDLMDKKDSELTQLREEITKRSVEFDRICVQNEKLREIIKKGYDHETAYQTNRESKITELTAKVAELEAGRATLIDSSERKSKLITDTNEEAQSLKAQLAATQNHLETTGADYVKLLDRLAKAEAVVEFYADRKNWGDRWDDDCDGDIFDLIDRQDVEICIDPKAIEFDESYKGHYTHGGKRARAYMKQKKDGV